MTNDIPVPDAIWCLDHQRTELIADLCPATARYIKQRPTNLIQSLYRTVSPLDDYWETH